MSRGRPRCVHVFPSFEPGGAELRVANIINASSDRFAHAVLSLDGRWGAAYRLSTETVELLRAPAGRGSAWFAVPLWKMLRRMCPDLVITYNWGATDAALAAAAGRICPVVHNECGFSDDKDPYSLRRRVVRRLLLNRIQTTVVTSRNMFAIARNMFGIVESKLRFIRTGVDTIKFQPRRDETRRRSLGAAADTLLFGYVGGLRREKNVDLMLRAFAQCQLEDARLVLFGNGPCRQELEGLAASLGAASRILFSGHCEDVASCYASMDVFLMSSRTEQTPNALLEAMAGGLPAVVTDVGDVKEILGEPQSQFVVPSGDVAAYASALTRIASDEGLRHRLGISNRARAVDVYDLNRMISEYVHVYERALAG